MCRLSFTLIVLKLSALEGHRKMDRYPLRVKGNTEKGRERERERVRERERERE